MTATMDPWKEMESAENISSDFRNPGQSLLSGMKAEVRLCRPNSGTRTAANQEYLVFKESLVLNVTHRPNKSHATHFID